MNELNKNNTGVVIAQIVEKLHRKRKDGKPFWILKLSIRRSLTQMYFQLTGKKEYTLKSNGEPMYVFTERGRFVNTLLEGNDYFLEYKRTEKNNQEYFHLEDWNKLGDDKKTIERAWRLLINKGEEIKEEKITNQQLLEELEQRIKNGEIIIEKDKEKVSTEREFATDLKDISTKKRVNLDEG